MKGPREEIFLGDDVYFSSVATIDTIILHVSVYVVSTCVVWFKPILVNPYPGSILVWGVFSP